MSGGPDSSTEFGFDDESWMARLRTAIGGRDGAGPGDGAGEQPIGRLGEYELLEGAGRGAQGVVYKARQPRTGRIVAIKKVALADGHDERAQARFQREVELAASLRAEGIVTIHEVLADTSAVVMAWIDGAPADVWADSVRAEAGALRRIVQTVRSACDAVAFAHGRAVIHRDLKPGNILVDADGRPHVVDFGLARETGASDATLTMAGGFAGTPAYAPPEQLDRGLHEVDVRADVYAMGAVLYRMLSGREPFEAPTLAGLFDAVRRGHPPAPSSIDHRVDRELDAIALMAMRPRPEDRYQTMAELAEDLGRWLDRRAVHAHPPSAAYVARAFVRRHPVGVSLAAIALTLIVGLGAAAGATALRLADQRDRLRATLGERDEALADAKAAAARAELELLKSRAGMELLYRALGEGDQASAIAALDAQAARMDAARMPIRAEIEISNRLTLARTYLQVGAPGRAEAQAELAIDLSRQAGAAGADLAEALALVGEVRLLRGDPDSAVEPLREALAVRSALPEPLTDVSRAHLMLLEALGDAGRTDEAQSFASAMPPLGGFAGSFMAERIVELCDRYRLEGPGWARAAATPAGR